MRINRKREKTAPAGMLKNYLTGFLLSVLFIVGSAVCVQASERYAVTFCNIQGVGSAKAYQVLNEKNLLPGTMIILPEVPKKEGYQGIGWTTSREDRFPLYEAGEPVTVTGNMKFYAVRRESVYYTVSFYSQDGGSGNAYRRLEMTVEEGDYIRLPSVPARTGYAGLGWSNVPNAQEALYKVNQKITPKKDRAFYAVEKSSVTVSFYSRTGGVLLNKIKAGKGESIRLPGLPNGYQNTMMGWSLRKGQTSNPKYHVGDTITVSSSIKLYAVIFDRNAEPNRNLNQLTRYHESVFGQFGKFSKVIFVGDSRVYNMYRVLWEDYGNAVTGGISFICSSGSKISWLKYTATAMLLKQAKPGTAIIFNHGINDLNNVNLYVIYMRKLADQLSAKGCSLFYMSLNPLNNENVMSVGMASRPEESVRDFNLAIRKKLCDGGAYTYLDSYTYLMKTGYSTASSLSTTYGLSGTQYGAIDDGLHYTRKTYKRIFEFCMKSLAAV